MNGKSGEEAAPPLSKGAYILEPMGGAYDRVQYANLAPGKEVVLAVGNQADPIVTEAVLTALSERPVTITTVVVPDPGPPFHEPPLPVVEAVAAADKLIASPVDLTTCPLSLEAERPHVHRRDEMVLDHGRLPFLEEVGFRELAAEFGDPDELLSYPQVQGY